ncbi:hypothetical protein Tco_0126515 [Tanacetum coccineum]
MHTRAFNSELVEPERTLNQRRRRRNRRVPFNQRNNPPKNPRIVYPTILDINHFRHFLVTLEILFPMDAPKLSWSHSVQRQHYQNLLSWSNEITQEVLNAVAGGIFLYNTPNQTYQLLEDKFLLKLDWAKNQKSKTSLKKTIAFADEGSSNSNSDKIMARIDAMTLKMDAQYKELQNYAKKTKPNEDDIPISREEEAKFMQTVCKTHFYNDYHDRDSNCDNRRSNK